MNNDFFSRVFRWLGVGLFITFFVGFMVSQNEKALSFLFSGYGFLIVVVLELVVCIWLSARIHKMSSGLAKVLYLFYTALTGLTLSSIFVVYELDSIIWIFLATAIVFIIFSFIGKRMNVDLKKVGVYLAVLLLAVVILSIINIFVMNNTLNMVTCILSLAVFVGYIAYDIRKLDYYEDDDNMAIMGAFDLYLDFINIFIRLLELFGKSKD